MSDSNFDSQSNSGGGMLRRLWLLFAQTTTILLAVALVAAAVRPDLFGRRVILQVAESQPAPIRRVDSYGAALSHVLPAVVSVYSRDLESADADLALPLNNLGSGVIVSADGYILTSRHVIVNAAAVEVALHTGDVHSAEIIGADAEIDIAVLKIDAANLPAATFGDDGALRVGDIVMAIGNPFGLSQTVTMGIVSAVGRTRLGLNHFENFIQTDAAINPGNSGGALADTEGRLVGINSALYSRRQGHIAQGIGFAIPASIARDAFIQIVEQNADAPPPTAEKAENNSEQ